MAIKIELRPGAGRTVEVTSHGGDPASRTAAAQSATAPTAARPIAAKD